MSKRMKLDLEQLKVQSFVTSLKDEEKADVKGGSNYFKCSQGAPCDTEFVSCPDTEVGCSMFTC